MCNGKMIETGRVTEAADGGYIVESVDRPGYVTGVLPYRGSLSVSVTETEYIIAEAGSALAAGDIVLFCESNDGIGMILERVEL